jgi:3-hydroxybutyryl-CoA dehydrogenase
MAIKTVGVVGMGTMGHQIGLVFALGGLDTLMCDRDEQTCARGRDRMRAFLDARAAKGKLAATAAAAALARVRTTTSLKDLASAGLVVEAVFENLEAKRRLFAELDEACEPATILATNTSTLSVTEIAAATRRPERCMGAHFLIPAALTPLVELSRGLDTAPETEAAVVEVLRACGKETVTVADAPAFVVNRLYIPLLNEAFFLLQEGTATAEQIDAACVKGLGFPLGPLAASDASGLDVVLSCVESLHRQLGDKYRPAPALVKLVKAGHLGRKTGRGVYRYK